MNCANNPLNKMQKRELPTVQSNPPCKELYLKTSHLIGSLTFYLIKDNFA